MWTGPLHQSSTPSERAVLVWLLVLGCLALSIACFYLSWQAPPNKATEAAALRRYGFGFATSALALVILRRSALRLMDR